MEYKKNPELEIGRNSSLYFAIGLNVILFFSWYGLNFKSYDKDNTFIDIVQVVDELEEDIPITNLDTPPPPPPPPPAAPEIITVVEDVEEIEETVIESTETNQSEEIEIIEISDVEVEEVDEDMEIPFSAVESVPIFPGCVGKNNDEYKKCFQTKILAHVKKNFRYPEAALEMNIHGRVFVLFVIDANGDITKVRSRGPDKILEKEAERIVKSLPQMIPGKQRDKPVKVPFSLPINFSIQ